jgi:hypothetical protein
MLRRNHVTAVLLNQSISKTLTTIRTMTMKQQQEYAGTTTGTHTVSPFIMREVS